VKARLRCSLPSEDGGNARPPHELERLLSPSLSSIPNGGEGGRRPGEVFRVQGFKARSATSENSIPGGEGERQTNCPEDFQ
jgi:hypothetical protein